MCGIIGVYLREPASYVLYEGLSILQHRGQDAAGLSLCDGKQLTMHKGVGLVRDVFDESRLDSLKGNYGIGHARYPTSGSYSSETEIQPLYTNYPYGVCLAHNGNLTNKQGVYEKLTRNRKRHLNTQMDSEILLNMLAHQVQTHTEYAAEMSVDDFFFAMKNLFGEISGGFAVVGLVPGQGLFGFRDPYGIRPLCIGKRVSADGQDEYCLSSESAVFNLLGFERMRDVLPGEAVFIDNQGKLHTSQCATLGYSPCLFEYVYLARPDSVMDNISVYQARVDMGTALARKIKREWPDYKIDSVIPIPESARSSALELSYQLNVPYREGLVKNRYVDRTFIMPPNFRGDSVRRKLSAIESEFNGQDVLLVDDSIVRGTTSRKIVALARAAGANKVYFASAAPPVKYPNVYGINIPTRTELIAHQHSEEDIRMHLGCDKIFYQDLDEMCQAINIGSQTNYQFEASCFNGVYLGGDVGENDLDNLEMVS